MRVRDYCSFGAAAVREPTTLQVVEWLQNKLLSPLTAPTSQKGFYDFTVCSSKLFLVSPTLTASMSDDPSTELSNLRRATSQVDGDSKAFSEDSQAVLRNQRGMIDKLKGDNEQLKEELNLERKHAKVYDSVSAQAQIAKLQDTGDMYTRKIELEKRRIEELDKQMEIMHKKIWEQRQKMGGVNASRENNQAIAKQIQILENRLDKALKRYNEALANNKRLRENIDNLRRERLVFDQIYRKLEKELAEKKKEMARIIEISNKAYEARDAAQSEMSALKSQADKEQEDFEREWKELGKMIEQDRKMKDFMKKEREKLSQQEHRGEMTVEQEQSLKKKVLRGNWGIAKDRASIHASMEKVQSYEEAFARIQAATGISDIDELVTTFINAEDQNFALFNYVNVRTARVTRVRHACACASSCVSEATLGFSFSGLEAAVRGADRWRMVGCAAVDGGGAAAAGRAGGGPWRPYWHVHLTRGRPRCPLLCARRSSTANARSSRSRSPRSARRLKSTRARASTQTTSARRS